MRALMIDHLNEHFFGTVFLNRKTRNKSIDFFTNLVLMVPAFKKRSACRGRERTDLLSTS